MKKKTPAGMTSPRMPTVFATNDILMMNKSTAMELPDALFAYLGSRYRFRIVGSAKRITAETRAFSARIRLTLASGQFRASDVYWGRSISIRAARP